ncbi:MAG TPA: DUF1330 domain-containing protein [Acidimicrobiales bacterium]|nr:DUF1330 domain-containing protein [Acidimicrobiales bacterium]
MAAYIVAVSNVSNADQLREYVAGAIPTMSGVEVVAADEAAVTLEGDDRHRVVILKFESEEAARAWYDSEAYSAVRPLRQGATTDGWLGLARGLS